MVGAGLAGLSAATALAGAGVDVQVLEAADELGGRVRSRPLGRGVANLGGEWVGARHRLVRALAARHGLRLEPTRFLGSPVRWRIDGRDTIARLPPLSRESAVALARAFWRIGRLARGLSAEAPWSAGIAEELDSQSLGHWLRAQGMGDDGYGLFDAFVGDLVSRPIDELSLLHVAWWVRRNDGPIRALRSAFDARLTEGSQELARRLAEPFKERIRLGRTVIAAEQGTHQVLLTTSDGRELRARHAILALPAPCLRGIEFSPELDPANRRLADELAIGPATKIAALLPETGERLPRAVIGGEPLTACWRYDEQVTGFARPPHDQLPRERLVAALAEAFAARPGDLHDVTLTRWAREPGIAGCDVCFLPGQLTELGPLLRAHHGLIRFAGPERSSWPNNMEGALESGRLAALETLRETIE